MKKTFALFAALFGFLAVTIHAATLTNIEYGKAGGESLKLDASIPDGPGPFPAVILIHGGSWTGGDKSPGRANDSMSNMFEALTRGGFAWFAINYRLAPKYRYPADSDDVTTSIRWVKEHAAEYHVDPKRIAISGHSAGGHLAALAAVRASTADQVAAVVCFSTPFDLVGTPKLGDPMNPGLVPLFGFTNLTTESVAIEKEASPITYVKSGLPPFLILQGTADTAVAYSHATNMQARLNEAHVPCELISIPGGSHGMNTWDSRVPDYREQVVKWLQTTLNGRPASRSSAQ